MNGVNHYELLQCNSSALQHRREQQDSVAVYKPSTVLGLYTVLKSV